MRGVRRNRIFGDRKYVLIQEKAINSGLSGQRFLGTGFIMSRGEVCEEFKLSSQCSDAMLQETAYQKGMILYVEAGEKKFENTEMFISQLKLPLELLIGDSLSTRTMNVLKNCDLEYVWELVALSDQELRDKKNCGSATILNIQEALNKAGLALGMVFDEETLAQLKSLNSEKKI